MFFFILFFISTPNFYEDYLMNLPKEYVETREKIEGKNYKEIIDATVEKASERFSLPKPLVMAVIKVESDFNPLSVGKEFEIGLMQILPENLFRLRVENPFDPYENIMAGSLLLSGYYRKYGSMYKALVAYNAGEDSVLKPPRSTLAYIRKILFYYIIYREGDKP